MLNPFKKLTFSHAHLNKLKKPTASIITVYEHVVGQIPKKSHGSYTLVLCPIHGEKHPSMALYTKTNSCYCFSCGYSADIYKLIMDIRGVSFKWACEIIEKL